MEIIPNEIKNGLPDKCPVCNKKPLCIFRTWKPDKNLVTCEFLHDKYKECEKVYSIDNGS